MHDGKGRAGVDNTARVSYEAGDNVSDDKVLEI